VPGAVASQVFFGRFADWQKRQGLPGSEPWNAAFYLYAGVLLVGACGWLFIDPTRPIAESRGDKARELGIRRGEASN
jgi:hypothetical protein